MDIRGERLTTHFMDYFEVPPEYIAVAPGRVNLLGEHVDYNDGPVLPVAIDRQVTIAGRALDEQIVSLYALDLDAAVSFRLENLEAKTDQDGQPLPSWALYPAGVAWSLQNSGRTVCGLQAVYTSNIPIGAGLSSSAAIEVGFVTLWQALGGWSAVQLELAKICQRAENQYVGVKCGLMDQFASACGVADHALYFDTRSLEWEPVPLLPGTAIVIADSKVRRSLANSAYNDRRVACEQAVQLLREFIPDLRSLRDISAPEFAAYSFYLPPEVAKRAEHVVKEIARVNSAVSALRRQDTRAFGALMYAGHNSLRNLYEVSTSELDALVEIARDLPGCIGARLTGAGFGGCTVNLVEEAYAEQFIQALKHAYQERVSRAAQVYLCRASRGAGAQKI